MNDLKILSLVAGVVVILASLPCLLAPGKARQWMTAFPRNVFSAWFLTSAGLAWATVLLFRMPLGWFDDYKVALYVLSPLAFLLIVKFMNELLAPRALGCLFLLLPTLILEVARQRAILLVSLAYVMVVAGIMLVLSPYLFRITMARWVESDARCRRLGLIVAVFGVFVVVYGFLVY